MVAISSVSGIASAAASETTPRIPVHAMMVTCRQEGQGSLARRFF